MKEYIEKIRKEAGAETNERCRLLQEDYVRLLQELGTREAITRRFFLIFQYPLSGTKVGRRKRNLSVYAVCSSDSPEVPCYVWKPGAASIKTKLVFVWKSFISC